jgi:hypothetical protein
MVPNLPLWVYPGGRHGEAEDVEVTVEILIEGSIHAGRYLRARRQRHWGVGSLAMSQTWYLVIFLLYLESLILLLFLRSAHWQLVVITSVIAEKSFHGV